MTAGSAASRRVLARTPVAPLPASSPTRPTGITGRMSAPAETSSPEVCSFRLPQMCGFRLPLTGVHVTRQLYSCVVRGTRPRKQSKSAKCLPVTSGQTRVPSAGTHRCFSLRTLSECRTRSRGDTKLRGSAPLAGTCRFWLPDQMRDWGVRTRFSSPEASNPQTLQGGPHGGVCQGSERR